MCKISFFYHKFQLPVDGNTKLATSHGAMPPTPWSHKPRGNTPACRLCSLTALCRAMRPASARTTAKHRRRCAPSSQQKRRLLAPSGSGRTVSPAGRHQWLRAFTQALGGRAHACLERPRPTPDRASRSLTQGRGNLGLAGRGTIAAAAINCMICFVYTLSEGVDKIDLTPTLYKTTILFLFYITLVSCQEIIQ